MSGSSDFGKALAGQVLDEALVRYEQQWGDAADPGPGTHPVWAAAVQLYQRLDPSERGLLREMLRLVIMDTGSHILGILDGSSTLDAWIGRTLEVSVTIDDGEDLAGYLQGEWQVASGMC